jgi:hypothetical protein
VKEVKLQKKTILCEKENDWLISNSLSIKRWRCGKEMHSINKKMDSIKHETMSIAWWWNEQTPSIFFHSMKYLNLKN